MKIKEKMKQLIQKICSKDIEYIFHILDKKTFELISFDLFDTLVYRNVDDPTKIFYRVQSRVEHIDPAYFEHRVYAEKEARCQCKAEEITLSDIYRYYSKNTKIAENELMEKYEIEEELKSVKARTDMKRIYDYAVGKKIKIVITSDMYLDRNTIKEILKECGYEYYDQIFLSSEELKTKTKGTLFDALLKNENVSKNKILHIGDNPRGDFLVPRFKGIPSVLITPASVYKDDFADNVNISLLYKGDCIK